MISNLKEVFLSKIPPSLNNFRSLVQEDEQIVVGYVTPNFGGGIISPKEKIDIEMGGKLAMESGFSLPEILQNLDYDNLEDNMKSMEKDGNISVDFFSVVQEAEETIQSYSSVVGSNADLKNNEESSSYQTSPPASQT